jgi:hypothetical protein
MIINEKHFCSNGFIFLTNNLSSNSRNIKKNFINENKQLLYSEKLKREKSKGRINLKKTFNTTKQTIQKPSYSILPSIRRPEVENRVNEILEKVNGKMKFESLKETDKTNYLRENYENKTFVDIRKRIKDIENFKLYAARGHERYCDYQADERFLNNLSKE